MCDRTRANHCKAVFHGLEARSAPRRLRRAFFGRHIGCFDAAMSKVCLSYQDFSALCDQLLGGPADEPQQVPRSPPLRGLHDRFRGRWFVAGGTLSAPEGCRSRRRTALAGRRR
jgi:hypothetical protein